MSFYNCCCLNIYIFNFFIQIKPWPCFTVCHQLPLPFASVNNFILRITLCNVEFRCVFQLKCCGVYNYTDWFGAYTWPDKDYVPESCCEFKAPTCGEASPQGWYQIVSYLCVCFYHVFVTYRNLTVRVVIMSWPLGFFTHQTMWMVLKSSTGGALLPIGSLKINHNN